MLETINEERIANNKYDFELCIDSASNIDWKQKTFAVCYRIYKEI